MMEYPLKLCIPEDWRGFAVRLIRFFPASFRTYSIKLYRF